MENKASSLQIVAPPSGHIIACEKWKDSALIQGVRGGGVKIVFENEFGRADFLLPNKSCILYVSECDIIAGTTYKRKLVCSNFLTLVLVENTRLSEQYFNAVQKFVVFDLGLPLFPVSGQTEASQLIAQMVHSDGRENPFRRKSSSRLLEPLVLEVVQQIPGVSQGKAVALLQHFSSIQLLCDATVAELETIVGHAAAQQVHSFFHRSLDT
ncbi:Fanconi anemia core complex-associated protein 24 isoform X2 [Synchiropus splendidus]|uniref:Fanconi anemia core complex-associated protein 24 isoform X2 n=1 Tax=Synchiropus splendidus TaxID=270530 RepID=UPI00237DC5CC|nr:Fanconi anemia core complex-associated protein 24 isoform X2 [Synchiropus splendidus]